jgi:hypothetical protein
MTTSLEDFGAMADLCKTGPDDDFDFAQWFKPDDVGADAGGGKIVPHAPVPVYPTRGVSGK